MGEPHKKDFPPGWNDPPMLSYSTSNPPPKSRITNKRVAFPLGFQSRNQSDIKPLEPSTKPPLMSPSPEENDNECVESLYLKASENFNKLLESISDESIKEQIWQMLSAWQARKFSVNIQNLLTELSTNIIDKNTSKVNEIHLQLMMDRTLLVKTHLSALQHLINSSPK